MKVRLLFFAELRDLFGTGTREIELAPGATLGEAVEAWHALSGVELPERLPVRYAVNEEFAGSGRRLAAGDRVAFLTPFSGG